MAAQGPRRPDPERCEGCGSAGPLFRVTVRPVAASGQRRKVTALGVACRGCLDVMSAALLGVR